MNTRPDLNSIIDQLSSEKSTNEEEEEAFFDPIKEELVAKHLDLCLQNKLFNRIPLRIMNRILNSPKRVINDHSRLVSFVTSLIKEKLDEKTSETSIHDILALPGCLDYSLMSADEIQQLFDAEKEERLFIGPRGTRERMLAFVRGEKEWRAKQEELEERLRKVEESLRAVEEKLDASLKLQEEMRKERLEIEKSIQALEEKEQRSEEKMLDVEKLCKTRVEESQKTVGGELNGTEKKEDDGISVFEHEAGREFHGIMRFLTEKTGGNIHDNKTIEITTNSIYGNNMKYHPKCLVDYNNDEYYDSAQKDARICFDFKERRIQLSSYSIKSHSNGPGDGKSYNSSGHLRNWVVEVSNDGESWETVDRHENDPTLNGSNIVGTFNIQTKLRSFYRFVQLRQTGYSWYDINKYDIFFYYIEFYGKLKETLSK